MMMTMMMMMMMMTTDQRLSTPPRAWRGGCDLRFGATWSC
jgi:hypothetical protein